MRTILIILLSFQVFGQDTIQCPCDMTRQQTRLYYSAVELDLKLKDAQHKRENTKEIKSLRYGFRSLKVENQTIRKEYKTKQDSLRRSNALLLLKEKNRNSEAEKTLRNELKEQRSDNRALKAENRKKVNKNIVWIVVGVCVVLLLLLVMQLVRRK